ncbi:nucleotidyltransferase domain-containing protein [Paenibacillus aestuarii]|uniref:Nucleotidyltransferase domain-containing protein n=1 Tax=Paenibacillus aestuarii TaxID=516965 RepID=A0ABW0K3F9_9BACL|nr:nucleotidyltransferase domain-containing protein [Paenibacillus aestuarii]
MEVTSLLERITDRLKNVSGVEAVVLGGSRARGTHTEKSDLDIGIYYRANRPLDLDALSEIARQLDDLKRDSLVTPIGEWGPWINGGGWLQVNGLGVDFLYRELEKVAETIEDCTHGMVRIDYQPGHPHGFVNSIYMGEIAVCRPLWDPKGLIAGLKAHTQPYSPVLQQATVAKFLWEAAFSADNASKGVSRGDISYIAGHLFRAVSCLTQVLFALNGDYMLNEKGAVAYVARFAIAPEQFESRVQQAYTGLTVNGDDMLSAIAIIHELIGETNELAAKRAPG